MIERIKIWIHSFVVSFKLQIHISSILFPAPVAVGGDMRSHDHLRSVAKLGARFAAWWGSDPQVLEDFTEKTKIFLRQWKGRLLIFETYFNPYLRYFFAYCNILQSHILIWFKIATREMFSMGKVQIFVPIAVKPDMI
jgi:hypothetical protein